MDFAKIIAETTDEIFNCMIFIDIAAQPPLESGKLAISCHVSTMIGLTGSLSGMLAIHCPSAGGLAVAGQSQVIAAPKKQSAGCCTFYHEAGPVFC